MKKEKKKCAYLDNGKCYCTESKMKLGFPSERYCSQCELKVEVKDEMRNMWHRV